MTELTCTQFGDLSAELALGILEGEERADALVHAQHCDACQRELARQSSVADELVALTPAAEPPVGFETRVLSRLAATSRQRRRGRVLVALAAAAVAAAIGVGGWAIGHHAGEAAETYAATPAVERAVHRRARRKSVRSSSTVACTLGSRWPSAATSATTW